MKHVARRVTGESKVELGYGVFPRYLVEDRTIIPIKDCSEIGDKRPLHEQNKSFRLLSLHPSEKAATQEANKMSVEGKLA